MMLFLLLATATTGLTLYERKNIYDTRFQQALNEAERLITLLQQVTEENLAKADDSHIEDTFNVIVTHDLLLAIQLIASDGYIMYANRYELTGTNASQDLLNRLSHVRTKELLVNELDSQFELIYPIRQLAGNFSNHVAYIHSVFDMAPILNQVKSEVESRLIKNILFTFVLMLILFLVLLITVHKPLLSLKQSFLAMAKHDYRTPVRDSIWSEFSALSNQANNTRLILSEAAKEQAFLSQIFHVSEGLYILDNQLIFKRINNGFVQIFEETENQILTKSALDVGLITPEDRDHLIRTGSVDDEVILEINSQNKTLLNSASRVEVEGEVYYVGVFKDITQQKVEQHKRERAKDEFVASVSHELRTPLNGIIGLTKLLTNDPLTDRQQKNINNILGSSDLLLSVINEILDYSKIEAGQLQLDEIVFDFRRQFVDLLAVFEHLAEEKSLQFNAFMAPEIPNLVKGDPIRIQQVLNNFCSNALKFTNQGSISVTFQVVAREKESITIQCLVVDTGIGVSNDRQNHLFQAFIQEDAGTSRKYGGTGLGLYISKQLIETMGGKILFNSKKHEGSTFGFELPLTVASQLEQGIDAEEIKDSKVDISDVKILVVDDNHINVEVAKSLLEDYSQHIHTAYSGPEALTLCEENQFDVILMDIQMPGMDGMETLSKVREIGGYKTLPVFAVTANVMKQDVEKYRTHGFSAVVAKPFEVEDLVRQIQQIK